MALFGLDKIVGKLALAGCLFAGGVGAADTWQEWEHVRTKDNRDSVITYFCEKGDGGYWRTNPKTAQRIFITDKGFIVGPNGGLYENNNGFFNERDNKGSYRKGFVETVGKDESLDSRVDNSVQPVSGDNVSSVHVRVSGFSDGKYSGVQKDREEAILDAQRLALEQAGIHISSETTVENFQLKRDLIRSKAKGCLKGDYVERGYNKNKVYEVVFVGDVIKNSNSEIAEKDFELGQEDYAKSWYGSAKEHFMKAISLDNNNAIYYFKMGQALRHFGPDSFDVALNNYYKCINLDADNSIKGDAYACIAAIFGCKGYHGQNKEKVREAYKKGVELKNPYCIEGLKNFEKICRDNGMD